LVNIKRGDLNMFKKILFTILFLTAGLVLAQNQDIDENSSVGGYYEPQGSPYMVSGFWNSLPNSPNGLSRSCCAYVEIAGIPYIYQFGGGNTSTEMKRVARLNLNTNTWQNNYSTMPSQISAGTAIVVNGGNEIFVFGGNNSPGTLGKTLKYSVNSNSWQAMADMPTKITDALVVKYSETKIFIIGGGDGYFGSSALKTNKVQVYDVISNSYSYSTNYPINCAMLGGGLYRDTIISVGGYSNGGNAVSNCYKGVINPNTLQVTWTSIAPYPAGTICRMASYVAVKNTGVGILCTGGALGGSTPTAQTHFWNFCTQSWMAGLPENGQARSNYKACGKGFDVIYTVAGFTNTGTGKSEFITMNYIDGPCMNMVGNPVNSGSIPLAFELKQNYPNPFNPDTKISFALPETGRILLAVTNSQGEKISVVAEGIYTAGYHNLTFKAENLSSGVYFYTLYASGFRETKKMLLIK
jgi:hypothetical protein